MNRKILFNTGSDNRIIEYTTTDGNKISFWSQSNKFTNNNNKTIEILSHTYSNGKGIIKLAEAPYAFGYGCFAYTRNLLSVTFPSTIRVVKTMAFSGYCGNNFPTDRIIEIGMEAFDYSSLTHIDIPYSVSTLGSYAFKRCSNLQSATYGRGTVICGTFYYCENLTDIIFTNSLYWIEAEAFMGCSKLDMQIPSTVRGIGDSAFSGAGLTSVTIPSGVTKINKYAFYSCPMTSVTFHDNITSIGDYAFCSCNITELNLPSSLTTIGDCAFRNFNGTSVVIPSSVTSIGAGAFSGMYNATSTDAIQFPNEELKLQYFEADKAFYGCYELETIIFPAGITRLGSYFASGSHVSEIEIPNTVIEIGNSAFEDCQRLTSIVVPDSVKTIGEGAFSETRMGLKSVTIGSGIETIGKDVINYSYKITSLTIKAITPPTLDTRLYDPNQPSPDNLIIYVPAASVNAYKTADVWSTYADSIQAIQ